MASLRVKLPGPCLPYISRCRKNRLYHSVECTHNCSRASVLRVVALSRATHLAATGVVPVHTIDQTLSLSPSLYSCQQCPSCPLTRDHLSECNDPCDVLFIIVWCWCVLLLQINVSSAARTSVSPQSLRRNTFVHAPPRRSKMEADRVCDLVIVWVYHQEAQPVAKIMSQVHPGSQYHPEHESASSQATRHAHATETRILRYSLEQSDGACTLTSQPAPCTTLQDRFVRDSSAEASKQK